MYVCKYEYTYVIYICKYEHIYNIHVYVCVHTHTNTHTHTIPARRSSRLPPSISGVTRQTASPARSPSAANPSTGSRCSCRQAPSTCSSCRHSPALPLLYHCFTTALLLLYYCCTGTKKVQNTDSARIPGETRLGLALRPDPTA